ncbi:tRNA (adenosine(37)-N6)-threonylcarbamoyltransferase complex ATPase subunit type 1 TsaE [Cyclobacterium jeungdonense]|uniref:tRNA threonylcarbamoyladenosine biosynthesis protein TsaE n=1 Tax=Cyclobacterium jeungdonense TaxID=708087 RepID=A0ABT8C4R9_9BACT|nr:tRNA (adenosine(37)-N6)-threonylcarbamoyltransferase complex ATPase subunit type 1 TsaE [Cyclobacterium jeungdonense]MDN3686746.1 tRNA (adenosine(37)-N6)-threonylcarbamoyltransferase complex ATPase subunit type 1 TsaE [Cyclobacterium jeungdonense]
MKSWECKQLDEISKSAELILDLCRDYTVWVFKGEMGAGKTTLIKEICSLLAVEDPVSSPTFSIVNEYDIKNGKIIYHFDFYRIEDPMEAVEIGVEEYFYSGNYCFVEWAEKIPGFLPETFALIEIEKGTEETRYIRVKISHQ